MDAGITTVADLIRNAARAFADREAFRSFGVSLCYRDLLAQAECVTSWLQRAGLDKGDRVAIMMPNLLPYPVCLYGALLGGYVVVGVNPPYTPRELAHQLRDSGARALFALEPFAHVAAAALKEVAVPHVVVAATGDLLGLKGHLVNFVTRHMKQAVPAWTIPGQTPLSQVLRVGGARQPEPVAVGADDVAILAYTGGTTGVSKAAVILHGNVVAHTDQVGEWVESAVGRTPEDVRLITALPLYHAAALMTQMMVLPRQGGCSILVANPRELDGLVKILRTERFTVLPGINTLYLALLGHPEIGTEVAVRDEQGNAMPAGEHGEICVRGPQVMAGYWNRPDETAKVMTADGFLRTGDIGSLDGQGFLPLHDRKKDMILVSGFNVYPNEVEALLAAHPQILEACVVGVADVHSGEVVAASIVRRDPSLTEEAVIAYCREGLAAYKCPKRIDFADELPKSPVGKILRWAVRERWQARATSRMGSEQVIGRLASTDNLL